MRLNQIDVIVPDVRESVTALATLLGLEPDEVGDRFAQLTVGELAIMFSPDALVPMGAAAGVILHFEIDDDYDLAGRIAAAGAEILLPTVSTDWGTESTLVGGPGGLVIDLYRSSPA